ncbi:hypothetical protein D3C83_108460 [compost metagenome]
MRSMFGSMKPPFTLRAMPRAMGLAKNGIFARSTRLNTSFITIIGIAEPSAKCIQ